MAGVTAKSEVRVQDRPIPLDPFIGRAAELARFAEVISLVETGQPWLVAIEGDPGVGKTALARRCLAEAADLQVLSARADQAEADLDFGIVDQLLRAAGGSVPTATPNGAASSFSVGAGLLEVVGEQQAAAVLAIVIDDLQWADRKSVEALTFMLRRLSVDPVIAIVTYRGPSDRLDEAARRLLLSVENRLFIPLGGLDQEEVASLAVALRAGALDDEAAAWLYRHTGGHPLYLRTLLSEGFDFDPRGPGRPALPRTLAAAIGDHLRVLPAETQVILEMLAVLNLRMPLAQVGQAAEVESPSAAIEPAAPPGWWTCGRRSRAARWRSATRWSGMPSTRASRPPGAGCCTPELPRSSARRRPGSTGSPPSTVPTRTWPPSWSTWRIKRRPTAAWRWPLPACSGPLTSPPNGPAGNEGC